jgi:hypothetical protein
VRLRLWPPLDLSHRSKQQFTTLRGGDQRGIFKDFGDEIRIARSKIAAGGTIKEGLHKTPTTECVPQLFDARRLCLGAALLILHEI